MTLDENEEFRAHQTAVRGRRAETELGLTRDAFDQFRRNCFEAAVNSRPTEIEFREQMYKLCTVIDKVQEVLMEIVVEGAEAQATIQAHLESLKSENK